MKTLIFAKRNSKEILRDFVSIIFGLLLPIVLLLLVSAIQKNTAVEIFELQNFTPGIIIFSFSFITLFSGSLIAGDRASSFLNRLFASPMKATDYILGYSLPMIPISILQSIIVFTVALILGLPFSINIIWTILFLIPIAILFIALGILLGSLLSDKQVAPISSVLVQIVALGSGMWFDLSMVGSTVKFICNLLPFTHAFELTKNVLNGNMNLITSDLLIVIGYTITLFTLAIIVFKKKMNN